VRSVRGVGDDRFGTTSIMKTGEITVRKYSLIICAFVFVFVFGCDGKAADEFLEEMDKKMYWNKPLAEEDFKIVENGIKKAYAQKKWEEADRLEDFQDRAKNYMTLYKIKNKVLEEELLTKEEIRILRRAASDLAGQGDKWDEMRNLDMLANTAARLINKMAGIEEFDYSKIKSARDIPNEAGKIEGDEEVYYTLGDKSIIAIVDWVSDDKSIYHDRYEIIIYEDEYKKVDYLYFPENRLYINFTQNNISVDSVNVKYYFDSEQNINQFGNGETSTEIIIPLGQFDGPAESPFYGWGTGWDWNLKESSLMHITKIEIIYGKNDVYENIVIDSPDDIKILKKFFELTLKYGFR
jgi:hypothetical protein